MFAETCTQAIGAGYGGREDIVRQVKSTTQQASVKQYIINTICDNALQMSSRRWKYLLH